MIQHGPNVRFMAMMCKNIRKMTPMVPNMALNMDDNNLSNTNMPNKHTAMNAWPLNIMLLRPSLSTTYVLISVDSTCSSDNSTISICV